MSEMTPEMAREQSEQDFRTYQSLVSDEIGHDRDVSAILETDFNDQVLSYGELEAAKNSEELRDNAKRSKDSFKNSNLFRVMFHEDAYVQAAAKEARAAGHPINLGKHPEIALAVRVKPKYAHLLESRRYPDSRMKRRVDKRHRNQQAK